MRRYIYELDFYIYTVYISHIFHIFTPTCGAGFFSLKTTEQALYLDFDLIPPNPWSFQRFDQRFVS